MPAIYEDPSRTVEDRASDLLGRMTLEEKVAQLHAFWLLLEEDGRHKVRKGDAFIGESDKGALERLLGHGLGEITRPVGTRAVEPGRGVRALNRLQKFLLEQTRLKIPVLAHEECTVGLMVKGGTLFPSSLAASFTFNPDLLERAARAIGREARSVGARQGLAPVLDVSRDVRWGRTEETFGEDPYLVGVLGTRFVRGLQGEDGAFLATLKHFAAHSAGEGGRNHAPVHVGWRELCDVFLLPFEMAVKLGRARSVMPAYHDLDGVPCHASRLLLTEILRERWGFEGLVVADYAGVSLLARHHGVAGDRAEAAALAVFAGVDVELPGDECAHDLEEALERGLIRLEEVDAAVKRVLREKLRLGLFEHPYVDPGGMELRTPDALSAAREVARQGVVLLSNRGGLPIDKAGSARVAVIGPTADDPLALLSGYSFPVHLIVNREEVSGADTVETPRAALSRVLGPERVSYAKGCHILLKREVGAPVYPGDVEEGELGERRSPVSLDRSLIGEAVECARRADLAVVMVGDLAGLFQTGTVGEGSDTDSLSLPGVQAELLEAVVRTGTPTVAVLMGGRPYGLSGLEDKVAAFVFAPSGGEEGGVALAEVLTGAVEPSGRLSLSFPKSVGAVPYTYDHKLKSAGTPVAFHFGSRYPFGHGLSYTRFEYRDLKLDGDPENDGRGEVRASFTILNQGERPGVAVPQLYVRDLLASVVRPVRELKAFGRVALAPGEQARFLAVVPVDMLGFTGLCGERVVEPGEFEVQVGASSADLPLKGRFRLRGLLRKLSRDWRMTSRMEVQG